MRWGWRWGKGVCGVGGSHLHRATGVCAHAVSTLQRGGGGSEWDTAPEPHGMGGSGVPTGDTHTVAFLPLGAVGARQAALSLQTLRENA